MDLEPTTMRPVSPKMEPAYLTADPGLIRFIGVLSQSKVRKARADFIFFSQVIHRSGENPLNLRATRRILRMNASLLANSQPSEFFCFYFLRQSQSLIMRLVWLATRCRWLLSHASLWGIRM